MKAVASGVKETEATAFLEKKLKYPVRSSNYGLKEIVRVRSFSFNFFFFF
jgi:hypothetical protein